MKAAIPWKQLTHERCRDMSMFPGLSRKLKLHPLPLTDRQFLGAFYRLLRHVIASGKLLKKTYFNVSDWDQFLWPLGNIFLILSGSFPELFSFNFPKFCKLLILYQTLYEQNALNDILPEWMLMNTPKHPCPEAILANITNNLQIFQMQHISILIQCLWNCCQCDNCFLRTYYP